MQKVNTMLVALFACTALAMAGCDSGGSGSSSSGTDAAGTPDGTTVTDAGGNGTDAGPIGDDSTTGTDSVVDNDTGTTPGPDVPFDPALAKSAAPSDGTNCGTCPSGTTCSVDYKCEAPKNEMGEFCASRRTARLRSRTRRTRRR